MQAKGHAADEALRRLAGLADEEIAIGGAALTLALREKPGLPLERYHAHLDEIAADVAAAWAAADPGRGATAEARLAARLEALRTTIHARHGYAGDRQSYDDLQNANLVRVIDRRRGLPIALGIIYLHAGRAQGWDIYGLNFPGHFLLRLDDGPVRVIFDPFDAGAPLGVAALRALIKATRGADAELDPAHYAPASNREILIRLQNNRKVRLLKAERIEAGLQVVEDMLLFAPGEDSLWHEAGVLNAHLGNLRAALLAFEHCRDLARDPRERSRVEGLIADLRARLN